MWGEMCRCSGFITWIISGWVTEEALLSLKSEAVSAASIVTRQQVDKAEGTYMEVTAVAQMCWMDLVLVLVEITSGHHVMKWLVWGKMDLCGVKGGSARNRGVCWRCCQMAGEKNRMARERTRSPMALGYLWDTWRRAYRGLCKQESLGTALKKRCSGYLGKEGTE